MRVLRTTALALATLLLQLCLCAEAQAAQQTIDCAPTEVATFLGRVHIRCATGRDGIVFFAIATNRTADETAFANRAVAIGDAALVGGHTLRILYDFDDQSGAAFGCLAADCRVALAVTVLGP